MKNLIITSDVHKSFIVNMKNEGFHIDIRPEISNAKLLECISKYNGLVISSKIVVDDVLLEKATNLEFIGRLGSGMENINVELAEKKGIHCFNSPEGNRNAVAEQAVGMLLSLLNNIHVAHAQMRDGLWLREDNRGFELMGKTIGILGFGNTGQSFARKLQGFDVDILAYDIKRIEQSFNYVTVVGLPAIFDEVDILSLHLPLDESTFHMVNSEFLNSFKNPIVVINTSRGQIIDTQCLINAIEEKKVVGAVLDVFENEKLNSYSKIERKQLNFLLNQPNIICTPHIAGWTFEAREKMANYLYNKILETLK